MSFRCEKQIEGCHADAHAIADLFDDDRLRRVGSLGTNLKAAVHGTRVHDDSVGTQLREALGREAIFGVVGTRGGEEPTSGAGHALALDTQHHDRVRLGRQGLVEVVRGLAVPGLDAQGQQRRGRDESDTRA